MFKVYGDVNSGNCYKVKLLLSQLKLPFEWIEIDILKKETRTPEFLTINPNGRIPVLEWETGHFLWESNAIMHFLSEGTEFLPCDRLQRAQVLQWLFFEQYSHEPYIATSRYLIRYLKGEEKYQKVLAEKRPLGYAALGVMEKHLKEHPFFVGDVYSIADIGLYAYTHVAAEGGFDLSQYTAILAWFERIQSQLNYLKIG
ncbi:glutathione S-transferase family protein [Gloeocapsa sp. PCC 73106]|uniref:glutathione S-transferase family protein n=1 Tax=Gloeocapsa sp. PCC 73106 TaxID=102232 RepID=UPI0002ACA93B|nr:glutathione S-transferase family protein [Gloeocapsa sp. PCC 73106]ELS00104.1 glutathione S-transferase [Gloeocapsa sp. PCC 73106]